MMKYVIIHCRHDGCYDFQCYENDVTRTRITPITINPPKMFCFNTKDEANEFFHEYMNDVDVIDNRCKKGEEVEHVDHCTCGIIEMDDDDNPILFYNKKNQLFLLEQSAQVFTPPQAVKNDINNMNLTNRLIKKCKNLGREQRHRYIELGRRCQEFSMEDEFSAEEDEVEDEVADEGVLAEIIGRPGVLAKEDSIGRPGVLAEIGRPGVLAKDEFNSK